MAVVAVAHEAPDAIVTVMPADAFCANEWAFQSAVTTAVRALEKLPEHLLALATQSLRHDESQDYLVIGGPDEMPGRPVAHCIKRPTFAVGRNLIANGAWVNSGIYVTRVTTLIGVLENLWPRMMESVRAIVQSSHGEELHVPSRLVGAEFQRPWRHTWMQRPVARLRAVKLDDVAWSSLGSLAAVERLASAYLQTPSDYGRGTPDLIARYLASTRSRSESRSNRSSPPWR
jgi:mannose-1-phosphate guanylyltransferase